MSVRIKEFAHEQIFKPNALESNLSVARKLPFISSVQLARIDDSYIIPTSVYYENRKPLVGRDAVERCPSPEMLIEEFKIDLGTFDPNSTARRPEATENTPRRTPVGIAKDFFDETLKKINEWLSIQGLSLPSKILIAEPLSLSGNDMATESWLSNYRRSVRKALQNRFKQIDFLPEPFAVFQYYKHGLRHPLVAEGRKHIALVLDFGGGTFDVSVIETTKAGEISQSGVNSRPLSAKSEQVGGFFINRVIARELLFSVLEKRVDRSEVSKAFENFVKNKNADQGFLDQLSTRHAAFFRNMKKLLQDVERAKVSVCNSVANWSLAANLSGVAAFPVSVPVDPFESTPRYAATRLDAGKLRTLYEQQVWAAKLRQTIKATLERAKQQLGGQEITVVLLSGGSSNIRWLQPLLERDLGGHLRDAVILGLSDSFQEIVAKGLATECARRFYTEGQGDFRAVTYNRLCLALRSDDGDLEHRRLRPTVEPLKSRIASDDQLEEGVLLPAASSLRDLVDKPLRWKVRMSRPPKRSLEYYFMRSSFDPHDLDARHNIVDWRVSTPSGTRFQQSIEIELSVREDGTATPKFIYGQDNQHAGTVVEGNPFYMDMTFASEEAPGETYLGFDFGTSTSACSFVDSRHIQMIEERSKSSSWRDLAELVNDLPYPAAAPLARYLSEMDQSKRADRGREAVEAFLTLAAYVCLSEHCIRSSKNVTSIFKGLAHRSAGPLWSVLKQCLATKQPRTISAPLSALVNETNRDRIDAWITEIAASKHTKASTIDYVTFLGLIGNHVAKMFSSAQFGIFENVTKKRFGQGLFQGIFRTMAGAAPPFINVFYYEGPHSFSDSEVYVVTPATGTALPLSPFYVWSLNANEGNAVESDLYEYDTWREKEGEFGFKAVQVRRERKVSSKGEFSEMWDFLSQMRVHDQSLTLCTGLTLISEETG